MAAMRSRMLASEIELSTAKNDDAYRALKARRADQAETLLRLEGERNRLALAEEEERRRQAERLHAELRAAHDRFIEACRARVPALVDLERKVAEEIAQIVADAKEAERAAYDLHRLDVETGQKHPDSPLGAPYALPAARAELRAAIGEAQRAEGRVDLELHTWLEPILR
jgi:hypothetical protein